MIYKRINLIKICSLLVVLKLGKFDIPALMKFLFIVQANLKMIKKFNILLVCLFLLLTNLHVVGQQHIPVYDSISELIKASYQYTPQGYPESGVKYPLIIFVHGAGEIGPGSPTSLQKILGNGIPKRIENGTLPKSFSVNGQTFKFIIISPQFSAWPSVNDINNTINYAERKYPIDINRVYITGLSMGGGAAIYYPGYNIYFIN